MKAAGRRDWFDRWHAWLEHNYEGTADAAAIRLLAWCALVLVLCYAWASAWSASIVR